MKFHIEGRYDNLQPVMVRVLDLFSIQIDFVIPNNFSSLRRAPCAPLYLKKKKLPTTNFSSCTMD